MDAQHSGVHEHGKLIRTYISYNMLFLAKPVLLCQMVSFEADRLKEVSALKDKIKSLETEKAQACTSLSQLGLAQDKMKKEQVFLQHVLQARESELKGRQGNVS
jgi:hypothetical protein